MKRLLLLICCGVLGAVPIFSIADEAVVGVSITPLKYDLSADPGAVLYKVVTAINPNDFPLKVVPEFQDFRVLENAGIQWIPSDVENPYRMTDWISISSEPITLAPRQQTEVPFTIRVPQNASVGGHYAAIFFRAVLDSSAGTIGSIPRVGALVIFNVNGDVSKSGEIVKFSGSRIIDRGPTNFELSLKNTGTTHYIPKTSVTISNIVGVSTVVNGESDKFIYPGVSRVIKAVWPKSFLLGIYSAKAEFIDGNGVNHSESLWFIGFPWKYSLIILLLILVIRYGVRYLNKRFKIVRA